MNKRGLASRIRGAYALFVRAGSGLRSPLLLVLRLYWGWSFFQTGLGKLQNLGAPTKFFAELGIPFPEYSALLVGCVECFGGALLVLGLASRLAALPLIIAMIVAYCTADIDAVKALFSDPVKFLEATPFMFLLTSLIVFAFGPGAFSLDHLLGKKFAPAASAETSPPQSA